MSFKPLSQKGFTAVEAIVIIVVLAVIGGVGYYVYHKDHKTSDKNTSQTEANAASHKNDTKSKTSPKQKYLIVKEWNVRFPYGGSDTYSYRPNEDASSITVISADLAAKYGCDNFGAGLIGRFKADEKTSFDGSGPTAVQAAAADPADWGHVGSYYFQFNPDQAACTANPTDASTAAQHASWQAVERIVPQVEAIPAQ